MSERRDLTTVPCVKFTRELPGPMRRCAHLTEPSLLPSWFGDESSIEPDKVVASR